MKNWYFAYTDIVLKSPHEAARRTTPTCSKTIAAQRLSSTLKGVLLLSAPGEGINMASEAGRRAEPANTPLVEQARLLATRDPRYGACVWGAEGGGESRG